MKFNMMKFKYYQVMSSSASSYEIIIWVTLKTNRLTTNGAEDIKNAISTSTGLFQNISQSLGAEKSESLEENLKEITEYMSESRISHQDGDRNLRILRDLRFIKIPALMSYFLSLIV